MREERMTKKELLAELRRLRRELRRKEAGGGYDPLTGLPDRVILYERLSQALAQACRKGQPVGVMFVRLANLKAVNDTYGREAGDLLLRTAVERIQGTIDKGNTLARPGRDEFIVLLTGISSPDDALSVAEKLLKSLGEPFRESGHELFMNVNIGISYCPDDGLDPDTVLKNAYTALGSTSDTNTYSFFSPSMNARARERIALENSLRHAIKRGEFLHHYQPQVDLRTRRIIGTEALIRWQRPGFGLVMPADFIPLAQEIGLIVQVGEWSLYTACMQQKRWQESGIAPGRIAVNVSARQFQAQDMTATVGRILKETGLAPGYLEIELSENILFQDEAGLIESLVRLKEMGVQVSIDDFGTGYSSLSYIRQFPVKKLKIVRSFVNSISINPIDSAIAKLIIDLSHTLDLRVLAEGVETREQLRLLERLGCDEVQGFYFYRPMEVEEVTRLLAKGKAGAPAVCGARKKAVPKRERG